MLSYWCWKQQAKNTSILITLEGTKRSKGQWSILQYPSEHLFLGLLSGSYLGCLPFLKAKYVWWQAFLRAISFPRHRCVVMRPEASLPREQHWCLSTPLSFFQLCFQMTKRMLYHAFKIVQPPPSRVHRSTTTSCPRQQLSGHEDRGEKGWLLR